MPDNKDNNGYVAPPVQQREAKQKTMATKPITSLAQIDVRKKLTSEEIGLINRSREQDRSRQNNTSDGIVQAKTDPPTGEHPAEERAAEANTAEVRTSGNVQTPQGTTQTPQIPGQNTPNNAEVRIPEENPAEVRTKGTIQNPQTPTKTPQGPVVIPPGDVPLTSECTVEKEKQATDAVEGIKESAEKETGEEAKPYKMTSTVGKRVATEDEKVNLGADVAHVQGHLLRLGVLTQKDYDAEKVTTTEEVEQSVIQKTIEAIFDFQNNVMGYSSKFGYVKPGKDTIAELVSLTPEDVVAKRAAVTAKRKEKAEEAEREKRILEEKELMMRVQERLHINMVVHAIYSGIEGGRADKYKVISALKSLKNDERLIKEAKKRYKDYYDEDLVDVIKSELSNVGRKNYLDKALGYLNLADDKESKEEIEKVEKELKEKSTPSTVKKDLKLREKGEKLLENEYYHKHYAYIPFTGKKTGTSYKKGDYIAKEDRVATYGSENKPTWCNMFARDLIEEVTGTDPFDGDKSAKQIHAYIKDNPETFVLLDDSFENVWKNEINKYEIVFLVDDGHIAVGIPTASLHKRTFTPDKNKPDETETYVFGDVVQAGKSHGTMPLSQAWILKSFSNIKKYRYVQQK